MKSKLKNIVINTHHSIYRSNPLVETEQILRNLSEQMPEHYEQHSLAKEKIDKEKQSKKEYESKKVTQDNSADDFLAFLLIVIAPVLVFSTMLIPNNTHKNTNNPQFNIKNGCVEVTYNQFFARDENNDGNLDKFYRNSYIPRGGLIKLSINSDFAYINQRKKMQTAYNSWYQKRK